jgi:hypothetical protein
MSLSFIQPANSPREGGAYVPTIVVGMSAPFGVFAARLQVPGPFPVSGAPYYISELFSLSG